MNGYNRVPVLLSALLLWAAYPVSAQEPELLSPSHSAIPEGVAQMRVGALSPLRDAIRSVAVTQNCRTAQEEAHRLALTAAVTRDRPISGVTLERCVSSALSERSRGVFEQLGVAIRTDQGMTSTPDWQGFRRDIVMQGAVNLNVLGIVYLMPESVTNWTTEQKRAGLRNYRANLLHGPHQDRDHWAFNYVTHPLTGAGYFITARRRAFGWKGALLYSSLVSTFGWEMGVEAFFEQPSVQDLWVTPLLGSIMGESMLRLQRRLARSPFSGARFLAVLLLGVMDPTGNLSRLADGVDFFVGPRGLTLGW